MKRRGILKIFFLLFLILISIFIVSCADLGNYNDVTDEDSLFKEYYKYFGDVDYMDSNLVTYSLDMDEVYNADTQDENDTPVDADKYKYIFVEFKNDVILDGISIFFKTCNTTERLSVKLEAYYVTGMSVASEDDLTCDMFRGTYEFKSTVGASETIIRIYCDGHGNCTLYVKQLNPATAEVEENNYSSTYTKHFVTNQDGSITKYFNCLFSNGDEYTLYFNSNNPDEFDGYMGSNFKDVLPFTYTNDFGIGKPIFTITRNFNANEWDSFYEDKYTWSVVNDSVDPPITTYVENQKKVTIKAGNGILFRIVNNCFDAKKYDLENVDLQFNNIVIRNAKEGE